MRSVRQLFSRVFDLALGAATALLLIGSAGIEGTSVSAAKGATALPVEYSAEVAGEPPPPVMQQPVDPKTQFLTERVRQGRHWRFDTESGPIHVWIPQGYDAATAQTVIYVHGYWQDADTVWHEHHLPEQFALSGINAMFIVPEAPRGKWDRVTWLTASAVLDDVTAAVGDVALPQGRLAVVGHSGAYRTIIQWLGDARVDTVVLLDAAYVDVRPYRDWVVASKKRRFLNVSIDTIRWSNYLHRWLPGTVTLEPFPREITDAMKKARILYVKSDIGHWPLVTEGVALPTMLRTLGAPSVLAEEPPVGLPLALREPFVRITASAD